MALGAGCGAYFALKAEPPAALVYAIFAVALVAAVAARKFGGRRTAYALMIVAFMAGGGALSKWRTDIVAAPIVQTNLGVVRIEGWVVDVVGSGARGDKVLLAPSWIRGLSPGRTPVRIRLVLNGRAPNPGSAVSLTALLDPPPPQSAPGSHDFPRDFYFKSIGGVGLAMGRAHLIDMGKPPWRLAAAMAVNRTRWVLANRIAGAVGNDAAGPAAAMTTGEDAFLTEEQRAAMRDAGLAHLLAIGGLHMGIVAGFVFFLTRLVVAGWPWLALRINGKKVAATCGLVTVGVYLLMSGGAPSAERAAITAATAFTAILLDRRAITFNALAIAAMLILALRPESIVGASFQMSFSATAALIALGEAWPHRISEISAPRPVVVFQRAMSWIGAGLLASFIAGSATGPFSVYQFNSTANYGVIGNALEMPISTFLTMPALALGAALQMANLGQPFLFVAAFGLRWTLAIGRWVSALPFSVTTVASPPTVALPLSFLGVCFVCLWRGRLRWVGLPLAATVFWWPKPPPPDVWVPAEASNAAVRVADHALPLRDHVKAFDLDLWSKRRKLALLDKPQPAIDAMFECDRFACKFKPGARVRISGWWGRKPPPPARLDGLCANAEIVIARSPLGPLPATCAGALVLDGADFAGHGALELWRRNGRWVGQWASDLSGVRPWAAYDRASGSAPRPSDSAG